MMNLVGQAEYDKENRGGASIVTRRIRKDISKGALKPLPGSNYLEDQSLKM